MKLNLSPSLSLKRRTSECQRDLEILKLAPTKFLSFDEERLGEFEKSKSIFVKDEREVQNEDL